MPGASDFKDHFSSSAPSYARYRPHYPPELAAHLAALTPRRERAWDAGCGSGQMSVALAEHFEEVIATDASAEQLERATAHPRVAYRRAPAEASGIESASVDLVVAAQSAHWFEIDAFHAEARRVGRPGALLALVGYGRLAIDPEIDPAVDFFYSVVLAPYWPPERSIVENAYRSLPFPFEELEAPRCEMRARWTRDELSGYVQTWSSVRALLRDRGAAKLDRFESELARAWPHAHERRTITWPLTVRLGRL